MHFSKTYSQVLLSLPEDLRENAIGYRQLKKLINKVVFELTDLGLKPSVLQQLLLEADAKTNESRLKNHASYELDPETREPQLRLWIGQADDESSRVALFLDSPPNSPVHEAPVALSEPLERPRPSKSLLKSLQRRSRDEGWCDIVDPESSRRELIIPLVSDSAFYQLLVHALQTLNHRLTQVDTEFHDRLRNLARSITDAAKPATSSSHIGPFSHDKSDLYTWRELFQIYIDSEIFESVREQDRGARSVEEIEIRLAAFVERVSQRRLPFKLKESRHALDTLIDMNVTLLNLKKFQQANAEAARKILKKHAKRTALPPPSTSALAIEPSTAASPATSDALTTRWREATNRDILSLLLPESTASLPHTLVLAISETLLPVVPHVDDYSCLICTSIAFKPIRLRCRHLFCVRCLVKMQKRGENRCALCRAETVLEADRSNVDWALLKFMQDWFPREAKVKRRSNEDEAAREELEEMGFDTKGCLIA